MPGMPGPKVTLGNARHMKPIEVSGMIPGPAVSPPVGPPFVAEAVISDPPRGLSESLVHPFSMWGVIKMTIWLSLIDVS